MDTASSPEDDFPGRLLHQAALWDNYELLEDLLRGDQRAHINSQDSWGRTPLHAAAITNKSKCLAVLLKSGADPNIPCGPRGELRTALHICAECGFVSNIKLLLKNGSSLTAQDRCGLTPLDIAERSEHQDCIMLLHQAANERENNRQQAHTNLREACLSKDVSLVKRLLTELGDEAELIVNLAPNGSNTLLFVCCEACEKELVRLLLSHGADGRCHPVTKYSPLYIASYNGHREIAEMLLHKFPELVRQWTVEKWLPAHAACIGGHVDILDLLLSFTYPQHLLVKYCDSSGTWEYEMPFDVNMKDASGQTILYLSCLLGNLKMTETLLKFRVKSQKINASKDPSPDQDQQQEPENLLSPGRKRISDGIQSIMSRLNLRSRPESAGKKETEKQISPLNLDLYCSEAFETALHVAVRNKHSEIATMLLGMAANPNITSQKSGRNQGEDDLCCSSLVEACRNRDVAMVDMLLRHGARDDLSRALKITTNNNDDILTAKLLSIKAHADPEYKLNKKAMTEELPRGSLAGLASLTYSSVFPNTPVMINWHGNRCQLSHIKHNWLVDAAIHVNPKLKLNPKNQEVVLYAITRLDLSNNALSSLPAAVFQLPSLRSLNVSQNKLEKLPGTDEGKQQSERKSSLPDVRNRYNIPVLEDLCCQNNRLEFIPDAILKLPALVTLDISNNKLQSLPATMWTAPCLKELNASFNLLKELPSNPSQCCDGSTTPDSPEPDCNVFENYTLPVGSGNSPQHTRTIQMKELRHQNVWSASVELTEQIVTDHHEENCSHLSALNLAHNLFTAVPPVLACLAVNLTRLNMSYNSLRSMSHVTTYPCSLKQVDLSYNTISCWPSLPQVDTLDAHILCYAPEGGKAAKLASRQSGGGLRSIVLHALCTHRRHLKLDNLRTLIMADNRLTKIQLASDEDVAEYDESDWDVLSSSSNSSRTRLLFPNLSMLDMSNNRLKEIPHNINELSNLSVLNVSGNVELSELPAQMGLLSRLWNLNTAGCGLQEPLKTMIESKKYKTMDVIGYLKSVLEDARPYARIKLMIVGVQGIGKTSLLEQLRQEGSSYRKKPHEHWAKRMGNKNINVKTCKGTNMSTVGVDIGLWMYDKKQRGHNSKGPVVFRTWDFGGQREYYATHQYFLSKRSLYLVVWKIPDGQRGIREIRQWLVNIQARAPNSPVLIVGTHYDEMAEKNLLSPSEDLQQTIRDKFINIVDAEKCGLPRVLDTIEVSCRTRHNIKLLCNLIYDTVFSLRPPGSKELLLEQRVPASYLALEDVVTHLAAERRTSGIDPVLNAEQYKAVVSSEMQYRYHKTFRDWSELHQATLFLHENGVLLHYEDATLRDLYFLDPQWLCDVLAHVVTIREINPFGRTGVMKLADLKHVFKSSNLGTIDTRGYIVNLLNKFEVALTWDNCTLLIPSLLPSEDDLHTPFAPAAVRVKIPVRSRGWAVRSKKMTVAAGSTLAGNATFFTHAGDRVTLAMPGSAHPTISSPAVEDPVAETSNPELEVVVRSNPDTAIRRLLLMSYFPSGFWSRLITRLLADDGIIDIVRGFFPMPKEMKTDAKLAQWLDTRTEWVLWQTGMELKYGSITLFRMKEVTPGSRITPIDYRHLRFRLLQDGAWIDTDIANSSILELYFPVDTVVIRRLVDADNYHTVVLDPSPENTAKLLALAVDHIDILLEDWYPTLGTRFVHTSEGKFLVTRLIPCPKCLSECTADEPKIAWPEHGMELAPRPVRQSQDSVQSDGDSGVGAESAGSSRLSSVEGHPDYREEANKTEETAYSWMVEECILSACSGRNVTCPTHGEVLLSVVAPDTIFIDLGERHLIRTENISKGPLLGRGAFGFVFKGSCKVRGSNQYLDIAMKLLQPVQPGTSARQSAVMAYKVAQGKWERDPLQYACKAYCTARQELNILLTLRHPNIVPMVGVCTRPLALVLDLAPQGALDVVLRHYRRSGAKILPGCLQEIILQVAKAVEYLHQQHIIYRDLKSENVLVWSLPPPFQEPMVPVHVKLADYGISRLGLPSGSKGFGGTEGFMAPEMMRYNGEEEYTEKVDCFSFGMFIYELLTLHQPFEGHESVKECILEGGRPPLTHRETLYPSCILDLMVLCWTQLPRDRPSASQIVSMASSPEFTQLCDCTALDHHGSVHAAASALVAADDGPPRAELWLVGDSRIDLLLSTEHGWTSYGAIPCAVTATAICQVGSEIWVGDVEGCLLCYNSANCGLVWNYALGDAAVAAIVFIAELTRVAVGLMNGRLFLVRSDATPSSAAMAEGSFVMTELGSSEVLFSLASVQVEPRVVELWVGEATGYVSVFTIRDEVVSGHDRVNHYNPVIDKVERVHLATCGQCVYSHVYPGCMVYQWDTETREISSTLDCTKLVPCSESLKPLTLEDLAEKCQVTCMSLFDGCVYVGTAWGCVVVADKATLYPITVFRPFEEEVKVIVPMFTLNDNKGKKNEVVALAGRGYRSLAARNTDMVLTPSALSPTQPRKVHCHVLLWKHIV